MPKGGRRNGYELRQGGHRRSSTLSLLNTGGFGEKVQLALPRSAISRKGNENYFEVQPRIQRHHSKEMKTIYCNI
jgi:hypothetical protein